MTRKECLKICDTEDIGECLTHLSNALDSLAAHKTVEARRSGEREPVLTERQHICSSYALEAISRGDWGLAMHELYDAFDNYERSEEDRELSVNEAVYFAAITKAMLTIYNLQGENNNV